MIVTNREGTELLKTNTNIRPIGYMYICMTAIQAHPSHPVFLQKVQFSDCGLSEYLNKLVH